MTLVGYMYSIMNFVTVMNELSVAMRQNYVYIFNIYYIE